MELKEKAECIIRDILNEKSKNPVTIFRNMADKDYIGIHGPEHHILDGACILTAYYNAGGHIDLETALRNMLLRGLQMPGAMCGMWGVCGAVTSIGAALAIIDETGPLSYDGSWGSHMEFTSAATETIGRTDGPRCCKRDAMFAFSKAVEYVNSHYDVKLEFDNVRCIYSERNPQCIKERCPFWGGR